MEKKCIFNGKIVDWKKITLNELVRGFLYGDGVFETMRSHEYKIFRLSDYFKRMTNSALTINLSVPFSEKEIQTITEDFLKSLRLKDAYIRISLWRKGPESFDPLNEKDAHYLITVRPLLKPGSGLYKKGISCTLSKRFKKNEYSPVSRIKSLSFLENVFCRQQAGFAGFKETIFSNTSGFLAEASVSNIFFVNKGSVFTPAVSCGIVPGITRKIIFEISAESGIKIKEGKYRLSELKKSQEVFITNTLVGILPITEIDNVKIGSGKPGALTKFFQKRFFNLTKTFFNGQN